MNFQLIFWFFCFMLCSHVCELKDISRVKSKATSKQQTVKVLKAEIAPANNSHHTSSTEIPTKKNQSQLVKPIAGKSNNTQKESKPAVGKLENSFYEEYVSFDPNNMTPSKLFKHILNYIGFRYLLNILFGI